MKPTIFLMLLIFVIPVTKLYARKIIKQVLVLKGVQYSAGNWELVFADKKNRTYLFAAKESNTAPYVFYSTAVDGSLPVNEKIRGSWFWVSYSQIRIGKRVINKIIKVRLFKLPQNSGE